MATYFILWAIQLKNQGPSSRSLPEVTPIKALSIMVESQTYVSCDFLDVLYIHMCIRAYNLPQERKQGELKSAKDESREKPEISSGRITMVGYGEL